MIKSSGPDQVATIKKAISDLCKRKDYDPILEFGVYEGYSLYEISNFLNENNMPNKIYGFDSFSGLPYSEGDWNKGDACSSLENTKKQLEENLENIDNIVLVEGIYEEVFEKTVCEKILEKRVSFIHIDCDLSSSVFYVLNICKYVMDSTFIILDDFCHGPNKVAWTNFCKDNDVKTGLYLEVGRQLLVEVLEVGNK